MYIESNRRAAESRADADFLRRMLGGELKGAPNTRTHNDTNANGCCEWRPQARQEAPVRPEGGCGCQRPCDTSCPTQIAAPSLAMVYSPRQCWHKLLDPEAALAHGSLFAELILPFEGKQIGGKEGCPHRHM